MIVNWHGALNLLRITKSLRNIQSLQIVRKLVIICLAACAYFLLNPCICISVKEVVINLYVMFMLVMGKHAIAFVLRLIWFHIVIFKSQRIIVTLIVWGMSWCLAYNLTDFRPS